MKKIIPFLVILSTVTGLDSYSQGSLLKGNRHKWGFDLGYGDQSGLDVDYFYEVYLFQYQYYFTLLGKEKWALEIITQPQFNLSRFNEFNDSPTITRGHEFGLNAGLLVRGIFLSDLLSPYLFISTGPHYISGVPERQSPGFIFSDNLFSGLSIRLQESFYLDLRFGFRHISNAGLKNPNGGINTFVVNIGFLSLLQNNPQQLE